MLTHLSGGSAGREGAASQFGGSLGDFFAKLFNFDDKDTRIMIMCGMSACFSALFGTPIAAAVFSMEVISVGVMYYAALVPCIISSLTAQGIAGLLGVTPTALLSVIYAVLTYQHVYAYYHVNTFCSCNVLPSAICCIHLPEFIRNT